MSAVIGYTVTTLLLIQAEASIPGGVHLVHYTFPSFIFGIVGIYVINVIFGLLPINVLLRHTPAEIMKSFDL